jgi:nucleoside-triphosphatase
MKSPADNILITGYPGSGKTTLIKGICNKLRSLEPVGFYTSEIREAGIRQGFELIDLKGVHCLLAHVNIKSRFRVGKYRVDIPAFERYLDQSGLQNPESAMTIIDEIGKMECYSAKFITLINTLLDSENRFIATIALKGGSFIEDIKRRGDVRLFEVTVRNRNSLAAEIIHEFTN